MNPTQRAWPEPFVAAVSLTYDGSRPEHLDQVIRDLDSAGLMGTFFAYPPELIPRLPEWRNAALGGHEIGNGFLTGVVNEDGLIPQLSSESLKLELDEAEQLISLAGDGVSPSSFAYPSVRTEWNEKGLPVVAKIVQDSIVKLNSEALSPHIGHYQAIRTNRQGFNDPIRPGRMVNCFVAESFDYESLRVLTQLGISQASWTVLVFSAMRECPFRAEVHQRFVHWLGERREVVNIAPFREVALHTSKFAYVEK